MLSFGGLVVNVLPINLHILLGLALLVQFYVPCFVQFLFFNLAPTLT